MKRNDNIFEENNMFLSEGNCESTDNRGQDIQELGGSVEFVCLVDQRVEAFVDCLSDHLPSGDQFSI